MDCTYAEWMDLGYPLAALITVVGMTGAYRLGARTRRSATATAVCPCKHAVSYHVNLTGKCNAWTMMGDSCRCRVYAGPELVSSLTMRPIAENS